MPVGELVTEPLPVTLTERVWFCANVAVTASLAFIATTQLPVPLQAPLQPTKLQPTAGDSVIVTCVPPLYIMLQVDTAHIRSGGLAVATPLPLTVRRSWLISRD